MYTSINMLSDRMSSFDPFTFCRHYSFCHHYRGRPVTAEKENNPYLCDTRLDSVATYVLGYDQSFTETC